MSKNKFKELVFISLSVQLLVVLIAGLDAVDGRLLPPFSLGLGIIVARQTC